MDAEYFRIYPVYLDSEKKISEGRKYPLNICIPRVKTQEIKQALTKLKIEHREELEKRHPKDITPGRFSLKKDQNKKILIEMIVDCIKEQRNKKIETAGKVPNVLNLVPIKKNKNKKK